MRLLRALHGKRRSRVGRLDRQGCGPESSRTLMQAGRGGCDQTGAAGGGVDARRWRILSSNPAMSAASTAAPSTTIQTFEPSLAGVAALGGSTTSSTRAVGLAS